MSSSHRITSHGLSVDAKVEATSGRFFARVSDRRSLLLIFCLLAFTAHAEWRVALPGWKYEFPRDHGNHPEFKTEWWYFTGNLAAKDGREFGYQLTFSGRA